MSSREVSSAPVPTRLVAALLKWFAREARDLPWRRTLDPYAIWVSEIMLQQTQVKTVIPYWQRWMRELPDIRSLAAAPQEKILKLWEGLGYYTRVRNLQKAAQQLVAENAGAFPKAFDAVLALRGVGRYTAGAITSIAFNEPAPILDGNVIRVLTRVFGIGENPRDKAANARLWELAGELVQSARGARFTGAEWFTVSGPCSALNQSLMELGALVCTPRSPNCTACPLRNDCIARATGQVESLPNLGNRATATERKFGAFLVSHQDRWLVCRRGEGVVNAGLWEFPNVEFLAGQREPSVSVSKLLDIRQPELESLCTIRHSITRYRIELEAWLVAARKKPELDGETLWLGLEELDALAFTSAHRKILGKLRSARSSSR